MTVLLQKDVHLLPGAAKRAERLQVLEGPTGRRNWPDDVKARIVAESFQEGARVTDTLGRIADHKITRIDELLPWRYAESAA